MLNIVNLLSTNKEWLFSGTGTGVISGIIAVIGGIIIWLLKRKNTKPNQTQFIGNNSSCNNQAGRDIKIK